MSNDESAKIPGPELAQTLRDRESDFDRSKFVSAMHGMVIWNEVAYHFTVMDTTYNKAQEWRVQQTLRNAGWHMLEMQTIDGIHTRVLLATGSTYERLMMLADLEGRTALMRTLDANT